MDSKELLEKVEAAEMWLRTVDPEMDPHEDIPVALLSSICAAVRAYVAEDSDQTKWFREDDDQKFWDAAYCAVIGAVISKKSGGAVISARDAEDAARNADAALIERRARRF